MSNRKETAKKFVKDHGYEIVLVGVVAGTSLALTALYAKHLKISQQTSVNYLDYKAELFATSLGDVTDAIINKINTGI